MVHAVDVPAVTIEVALRLAYCVARHIAAYNFAIVVAYVVAVVAVVAVINAEALADKDSAAHSRTVESVPRTTSPA
jgi:hypothetical protein